MKKVICLLTLAVAIAMTACNRSDGDSSSSSNSSANDVSVSKSTAAGDATQEISPSVPDVGQQPNANLTVAPDPNIQPPKPALSPEDAEKYKESISLMRVYGEQVAKCADAVSNGKPIDDDTKKQIAELQKKLGELKKAGKMHKDHIVLYNTTTDIYNQMLNK